MGRSKTALVVKNVGDGFRWRSGAGSVAEQALLPGSTSRFGGREVDSFAVALR